MMSKKVFLLTICMIVAVAAVTAVILWKPHTTKKQNTNAIPIAVSPETVDPHILPDMPTIADSRKTKGEYVTIDAAELEVVGHVESKSGSEIVTYTLSPKITISTDHDIFFVRMRKIIVEDLSAKGTCTTAQVIRQYPDLSKSGETFRHMTVTFDVPCDPGASYTNNVVTRLFGGSPDSSKMFSYAKLTAKDVARTLNFGIVVTFRDNSMTAKSFSVTLPGNGLVQTAHEVVPIVIDKKTF